MMALPPVNEQPKIITSGEQFNQHQLSPPPYPQQIQQFQNGCNPNYNSTTQPANMFPNEIKNKKERDELRIPAIIITLLGCFCGIWICGIPAFILAMLPECKKSLGSRSLYITSMVLSAVGVFSLVMIVLLFFYDNTMFMKYLTHLFK